ncbi:MAG TPA: sulfotransferase family protein [Leptolyngbyaceae cyanobacterium]
MSLSVIGAGFGRTGTLSLKAALEMLGYGPCYHMIEVFAHPEHIDLWNAATDGEFHWDEIFDGFRAAVDWPACAFWQPLLEYYPDAKVILTVRDPNRWYESALQTIYGATHRNPAADTPPIFIAQRAMAGKLVWERTFGGRFDDRDHAIAVFNAHNEAVKAAVPANRLLVFEARQGWEPLCTFLGCPVPDAPFPNVNSTEEFLARTR